MSSDPARCQTPRGAWMGARERQLLLERPLFGRRDG